MSNSSADSDFFSNVLQRVKASFERCAQKPFASLLLFVLAFIEASLFPLAPDFLFLPLSVLRPKRSLFYAAICVAGSTCGAILGYYIGYSLFDAVGENILLTFGWTDFFSEVLITYKANAWSTLLAAGFMPIPFQVFTFAAGFKQTIPIETFVAAALVGRSLRFFALGGLLFFFGERIRALLDKRLGWMCVAVLVLILLWVWMSRI